MLPYFLAEVYNQKTLHPAFGCRSPKEFEDAMSNGETAGYASPDPPNPSCPIIGMQSGGNSEELVSGLGKLGRHWSMEVICEPRQTV